MTAAPARITWAVHLVDPGPGARLLEVGCGPGVAAHLLCERLTTGSMLAVDRSAVALRRAAARNAAHIDAGRLHLRQAALDTLDLRPEFDVAFTVDVNAFWTRPDGPELGILAGSLRPGGRLLVLYGTGPATSPTAAHGAGGRVTGPILDAMTATGLIDARVITGPAGVGVTGRRRGGGVETG